MAPSKSRRISTAYQSDISPSRPRKGQKVKPGESKTPIVDGDRIRKSSQKMAEIGD